MKRYSVKDVQELYGVSQATVLHWIATGQLSALDVGRDTDKKRARYCIKDEHIRDFEASRTVKAQAPKPRRRAKREYKFY